MEKEWIGGEKEGEWKGEDLIRDGLQGVALQTKTTRNSKGRLDPVM